MDLNSLARKALKNKVLTSEDASILYKAVSHMPEEWTVKQKAFHLIKGNLTQPACKICGRVAKFNSKTYWKWCSHKCMGSDPEVLEKKKQTNIQKWGVPNPQSLPAVQEKQHATLLARYGVKNFAKSSLFQERSKSSCIKKYGVDNVSKNPAVIEQIRQKALLRNTNEVLQKRKYTCTTKFGTPASSQRHLSADVLEKLHDLEYLAHQHLTLKKSCQEIADELGCSPTPILTRLATAGIDVVRHSQSQVEKEILEYISQFTDIVETHNRSIIAPKELDIYIPSIRLAIEVNGVYWHSELNGKDKNYHKFKTNKCNEQGIKLYHILDSEWRDSKDIVKSKIKGAFGMLTRIPARKCIVKQVPSLEKSTFLANNHLQGNSGSSVNLGLYYNNELVSIATFGKSRYNNNHEWELIRFCNKCYVTVQGGASRLLSHFINTYSPESIVSYADLRWSTGDLYEKLKFKYSHTSAPNYFYFKKSDPSVLLSRMQFQKHKLIHKVGTVNLNNTEWEIMQTNNYDRIWDCGNNVYTWKTQN
jgi:hypothetical protein